MPDLNPPQVGDACAFCDRNRTRETLLYEGGDFYVIADYAPTHDAHLLLIPRQHFKHLASLPPALDAEFEATKRRLGEFVRESFDGALTCWENGVFGQSVPHAHQHLISMRLDPSHYASRGAAYQGIEGLRQRHAELGRDTYFTLEQDGDGRYLPPDRDLYMRVVGAARQTHVQWRFDRDGRREHGRPIVEAMKELWAREQPLRGLKW